MGGEKKSGEREEIEYQGTVPRDSHHAFISSSVYFIHAFRLARMALINSVRSMSLLGRPKIF